MKRDELQKESLMQALGDGGKPSVLCVFDELDSTNNEAKRMALSGIKETALIVANRQTAGRGRLNRSFFSPADTGAYFSILYTPSQRCEDLLSVTGAASVAVMRAVRTLSGKQTRIKWVNDLYLDGKKICGILTEALTLGDGPIQVIVGIGINLQTKDFPKELADKAGSLQVEDLPRAELIAEVWKELKPFLEDPLNDSWLEDYRTFSCVIGKTVTWEQNGRTQEGIAMRIDDTGALIVALSDGSSFRLRSGEISIRADFR